MKTLESLIVTDVHTMDVTQKIMDNKVKDTDQFEWIAEMRHYTCMESPGKLPNKMDKPAQLEIKIMMINSTRYYGFEYQGN